MVIDAHDTPVPVESCLDGVASSGSPDATTPVNRQMRAVHHDAVLIVNVYVPLSDDARL